MDRRTWLKMTAAAGAALAAGGRGIHSAIAAEAAGTAGRDLPEPPEAWTGHNRNLDRYYRAPGYPAFAAHPRYLGELAGSWHDMGKQYGERAGDLIRMVYEGWYRELVSLGKHSARVREEATALADALSLSTEDRTLLAEIALHHDWGKAHEAFVALTVQARAERGVSDILAKWPNAPMSGGHQEGARKYFRHELASALAYLEAQGWRD
ncbi:MAG: hypothetical protein ACRD0Y_13610, partial [Terriglobales bacterium]